jgi:(2Fe-2S) ferredoxin
MVRGAADTYRPRRLECEQAQFRLPSISAIAASSRIHHPATVVPPPPVQLTALMEPYARHVLVCTGGYCSPNREGRRLYTLLPRLLEREDLLFGPRRVKRGETPCLGVCAGGPIIVVYPEGVWYARVTPELLERIVVEHLRDGKVVEQAVFHRHGAPAG